MGTRTRYESTDASEDILLKIAKYHDMRPFRHLPVFSFFVACLLLVVSAQAQVPDYIRAPLTGRGHALLIGVSHYGEDSGWTPLPSVSDDIAVLQNSLAPHFATVDTLLNWSYGRKLVTG